MPSLSLRPLIIIPLLLSAACGSPGGGGGPDGGTTTFPVDPVKAMATAGCEPATPDLLVSGPAMLPGRECLKCHVKGGQSPNVWTAAGTVFGSVTALCNPGGVAGVKVEILNAAGKVQATMTTDSAGNFYTAMPLSFPISARISQGGIVQTMLNMQTTGDCASCHTKPPTSSGAPGRISLNL